MSRVLIAGAGIGGLTAALALARVGIATTILERSAELETVGAGIQLSPNATRILARLGLLDAIAAYALQPGGIRVRNARAGRTIAVIPLDDAERRYGAPYLVVHRAHLQAVLKAAVEATAGIELFLGTAVAGFGTSPRGVSVTARQGRLSRSFEADALIGADGVRSAVRAKLVDAADTPLQIGRLAWRAQIPAEAVDPLFGALETGLWLGRDAHLVHYPLNKGRTINVVAITPGGTTSGPADLWSAPGDPALLQTLLARWHHSARALIATAPTWTTWLLFDRAPLAAWNSGRVALLGDAAHPILPFQAQGAAQAIEDAADLAEALAATRDVAEALARYSAARRARAARVQDEARRLGRIYHLAGPAALARDATMRMLGGRRLLARYDWLYGLPLKQT